jgi:hypothetical protein
LNFEKERLDVEKQRLSVEEQRLEIEKERLKEITYKYMCMYKVISICRLLLLVVI